MVVVADEEQEKKKKEKKKKEEATNIKSNNPHLAGGEYLTLVGSLAPSWQRSPPCHWNAAASSPLPVSPETKLPSL